MVPAAKEKVPASPSSEPVSIPGPAPHLDLEMQGMENGPYPPH